MWAVLGQGLAVPVSASLHCSSLIRGTSQCQREAHNQFLITKSGQASFIIFESDAQAVWMNFKLTASFPRRKDVSLCRPASPTAAALSAGMAGHVTARQGMSWQGRACHGRAGHVTAGQRMSQQHSEGELPEVRQAPCPAAAPAGPANPISERNRFIE